MNSRPESASAPVDETSLTAKWQAMAGKQRGDQFFADIDAAEWVTDPLTRPSSRILDQSEIDSLLGFQAGSIDTGKTGIQALINSALVSYERLPMLDVIFDRLVRVLTTSLRNFTSDNIDVSLESISSVRFGDYLNAVPLPAMISVFRAEEWDNYALATIDSQLIYSIVDVLLGGRRGVGNVRVDGRPYTTIETSLVEKMIELVLKEMSAVFEPLSAVNFKFERIETNPRFASIARPTNAAVVVRMRVDMEDRGGMLELLFPYATLEPVRELLLQRFMGEKFGRDSIWETHLAGELWRTETELAAVLDEQTMTLGEVMNFQVGQTLLFNRSAQENVEMRCGTVTLCTGRLGRSRSNIAVQIRDVSSHSNEELQP
jgi:flagellar motor switch protein FliM